MGRTAFGLRRHFYVVNRLAIVLAVATAEATPPHSRQKARSGARHVTSASWYGQSFRGRRTANGSIFNPEGLTAAHPILAIGSTVKVTAMRSGRSVVIQITDRVPYQRGRGIDLTMAAGKR